MRTSRFAAVAALMIAASVTLAAEPIADPRMCGEPLRGADGKIARSAAVKAEFRRLHACPSTKRATGACPGWEVDHVIPLACGGCDAVGNMQWLPAPIKRASGPLPKDRWERKVYCPTPAKVK